MSHNLFFSFHIFFIFLLFDLNTRTHIYKRTNKNVCFDRWIDVVVVVFNFDEIIRSGSPTTLSSINGANITILPNKSALYGNSNNNNVNINTITAKMTSTTAATATSTPITTTTNKVVPNHGKPNCAPKPPGIQNIVTSKNGLSPLNTANSTLNNGNSNRPIVSRAHSMRSPRFVHHINYYLRT